MRAYRNPAKPMALRSSEMISPAPSGNWLVVLDGREANVFRSVLDGAVSQCIRSRVSGDGAASKPDEVGRGADSPSFFEPLAGVLHGADRILIFGRVTPLGDETGPFVFWLCNQHPELASRIVASVPIEPAEMTGAGLLAKARACYARMAMAGPPSAGSSRTDRRSA
jgi:hypothetical protein